MEKYYKNTLSKAVRSNIKPANFEFTKEQKERFKNISAAVLAIVAAAGVIAVSIVAPNVLQLIPQAKKLKRMLSGVNKKEKQQKIIKSFYYLKTAGLVNIKPKGGDYEVKITRKGREKIRLMNFESLSVARPKIWNKRWWVVLADIPTKDYKRQADLLRRKLRDTGFYALQRTVWVYPFDPRDELDFICHYYGLANFVTAMEVLTLDPSDRFKLKDFFHRQGLI